MALTKWSADQIDLAAKIIGSVPTHALVVADIPEGNATREGVLCLAKRSRDAWDWAVAVMRVYGVGCDGVPLVLACQMFAESFDELAVAR